MPQLPLFEKGADVLLDDASGRIEYVPDFVSSAVAAGWFSELRAAVDWEVKPRTIAEAAARVAAATGAPFNAVGLNLYRDGNDSVAPHNDHLYEIVPGFPIALLSLGATRRMNIRSKEPSGPLLKVDLVSGSLLTMSYETQLHYTHGIPKTRAPVGERISLAFRVRPPEAAGRVYA